MQHASSHSTLTTCGLDVGEGGGSRKRRVGGGKDNEGGREEGAEYTRTGQSWTHMYMYTTISTVAHIHCTCTLYMYYTSLEDTGNYTQNMYHSHFTQFPDASNSGGLLHSQHHMSQTLTEMSVPDEQRGRVVQHVCNLTSANIHVHVCS